MSVHSSNQGPYCDDSEFETAALSLYTLLAASRDSTDEGSEFVPEYHSHAESTITSKVVQSDNTEQLQHHQHQLQPPSQLQKEKHVKLEINPPQDFPTPSLAGGPYDDGTSADTLHFSSVQNILCMSSPFPANKESPSGRIYGPTLTRTSVTSHKQDQDTGLSIVHPKVDTEPSHSIMADSVMMSAGEIMVEDGTYHPCTLCSRSFQRIKSLQMHMRSHNVPDFAIKKHHICRFCGRTFTETGNLRRHVRTHTGEKPYKCKACGKHFSERGNLRKHMRTHTGEKPYSCDICGKHFSRSDHRKSHVEKHAAKPYCCPLCKRMFADSVTLRSHINSLHYADNVEICSTCGNAFANKRDLGKHERSKHQ